MMTQISNEAEYRAALARASSLMDAEKDTPEGEELDKLGDLLVAYEDAHYPMGAASRRDQQEPVTV